MALNTPHPERLHALRRSLHEFECQAFILPVQDAFQGEYVPACDQRLHWLTGFSGSAGMAVVLEDRAALFTDGRYTLQAPMEVPDTVQVINSGKTPVSHWLGVALASGNRVAYDPWLHTQHAVEKLSKPLEARGITLQALAANPVDALWEQRPERPASPVAIHPLEYAGEASQAKRARIADILSQHRADAAILTDPASVCWLLNVRGRDIPFTPFILTFAIVHRDGQVVWFIDETRIDTATQAWLGPEVRCHPPKSLEAYLNVLAGKRVMCDPATAASWFFDRLAHANATVVREDDPCLLPKAIKNDTEQAGMRTAHARDGIALRQFLQWLPEAITSETVTERTASEKLESFRREQQGFVEPSFHTISGFGSNGAIVHYRVTPGTDRTITGDGLYLVDSGGQYNEGTTDVTRTVAIGTPTPEQQEMYTRVLKGHIAIARALFPKGTTGAQLDTLARYHLWQSRTDYDHGTGHGVGSFLSVHEGPQRISKRGGGVALEPGMILSNEPGYYKAGEYGIRIENLVLIVPCDQDDGGWMQLETLTRAPLDDRLIVDAMLSKEEREWVRWYQDWSRS